MVSFQRGTFRLHVHEPRRDKTELVLRDEGLRVFLNREDRVARISTRKIPELTDDNSSDFIEEN